MLSFIELKFTIFPFLRSSKKEVKEVDLGMEQSYEAEGVVKNINFTR